MPGSSGLIENVQSQLTAAVSCHRKEDPMVFEATGVLK